MTTPRALHAVLFDMDGTICDTEPAWMVTEAEMAAAAGAEWTHDDAMALVGNNLVDSGIYIKQRMGLAETPEQIVDNLLVGVIARIRAEGVAWRPGALDLLAECNQRGIPTALVTMSYRSFAEAVIEVMPFGRFDVTITGDEVALGKPAPDAYLAAAAALSVDIASCVAIEDSPTGAASAAAAGARVVVVPNHVEIPLLDGYVEWPTLAGRTADSLAAVVAER